jgi:hypothetical protein
MITTAPDIYLVRDESIRRLERVVYALAEAAKHCGEPRDKMRAALEAALFAECDRCGARVSGRELLLFSDWPTASESVRIRRLRTNRCVRPECTSQDYQLIFRNHPDVDWPRLFSSGQEPEPVAVADDDEPEVDRKAAYIAWRHRMFLRIGVLAGALLLLFIARQYYYGGRIPLIREPESFRVDFAPEGELDPRLK